MVTVIYDERREPKFIDEFKEQGITTYEVFPAITDRKTVVECINASHRSIVAIAKYRKDPFCFIMEDDVIFTKQGAWDRFVTGLPKEFDLYLGGCYNPVVNGVTETPVGFHCYAIHERYYDKFLATEPNKHIDSAQSGGLYKVCYPMIALQRPGFSLNNRAEVNYNTVLKPEDIWQ